MLGNLAADRENAFVGTFFSPGKNRGMLLAFVVRFLGIVLCGRKLKVSGPWNQVDLCLNLDATICCWLGDLRLVIHRPEPCFLSLKCG